MKTPQVKTRLAKSCINCEFNLIYPLKLPSDATTFCGFKIPEGKRYLCALQIKNGDFAKAPIFHAAGTYPLDCPLRPENKKEGGEK